MKPIRIIIAGSRKITDYETIKSKCIKVMQNLDYSTIEIVSGGADGVDRLGERFAEENGLPVKHFIPDWSVGKYAGILRNGKMADYGTHLIAFWDGKSKGTENMITLATEKELRVKVFELNKLAQVKSKV